MQDTGSKVDGFGSLPPNFSSVPFTGRLEPGCGEKISIVAHDQNSKCQFIMLL